MIFYGELEAKAYPQIKIRCKETVKLASKSKLVTVKDAPHDISNSEYKKAIKRELKRIKS